MNTAEQAAETPYVRQANALTDRSCGAACLSMVYAALGQEVPQAAIWPAIAKENKFGSLSSTTHLMVRHALRRGLAACAVQARHPLQALRVCRQNGIHAIINHRLSSDVPTGHYSVLVETDDRSALLHDPLYGPDRRLSHAELLEVWQPRFSNSEIAGNVVIGIAREASLTSKCFLCRATLLNEVQCPKCGNRVDLQPAPLLGCVNYGCLARLWSYVCCPACDHMWSFDVSDEERALGPGMTVPSLPVIGKKETEHKAPDFSRLFAGLDEFCNHISGLPGAAGHERLKQQLDFIQASKEKIKQAAAEQFAFQQMRRQQQEQISEAARKRKEEFRKKMAELNTPAPSLDGQALGRALLKNLGFRI